MSTWWDESAASRSMEAGGCNSMDAGASQDPTHGYRDGHPAATRRGSSQWRAAEDSRVASAPRSEKTGQL
jgi:hypothetical protein